MGINTKMLNVICVLKTDINPTKHNYTVEWVDKLYNGVSKHLAIPFNFVCLSNEKTPYDTVALHNGFNGFWNKIEIFRDGIFDGPVLYFDLDVIICQDITEQIKILPSDQFLMVKEPYRNITNSSVMYFDGDYSHLYDEYVGNTHDINEEFKNAGLRYGDQAYISEAVTPGFIETHTTSNFIGWKHHKVETSFDDCSILIFTSAEKPSNNRDLKIVSDNWC